MFSKKFLSGAALTALSMSMASAAHAQSTASQIQEEEVIVTAQRQSMNGLMNAEQGPKSRTTITQEYIATQAPGQSIFQTLNLVPGVNFTNNDPYGTSGGNLRMRGFDGARVSLTFDGMPLNDTGNYAIFSNQMLDPELIGRANVNMGTTDVDSPTASATGGTINYVTRTPSETPGLAVSQTLGSDNYFRTFLMADTGSLNASGTRAFGAMSYQSYDQFVGPGDLEKIQANARLYQPLKGEDFMSLAFHFNRNRNDFYRQGSFAEWAFYGHDHFANLDVCTRDAPNGVAGVDGLVDNVQNDGANNAGAGAFLTANDNPANPSSCTNYHGLRINPSNTGNIRGQSRFSLGDHLTLTFDPSVQYVLANGGGTTVVSETDSRLKAGTPNGVDLNHDGDTLDSVRLYSPSNTNTLRYAALSSLIWDINDHNRLIFGATYDSGRHRQTGEYDDLDANGDPSDVFGGKQGEGSPILTAAGTVFQKRNRLSVATLDQFSVRYIGNFLNDALTVDLGVRAPHFTRDLDQRCSTTPGNSGDPTCGVPLSSPGAVGPFKASVEYDDVLPSVGVLYRLGEHSQIYASYAEGLSAPRTDDLYNGLTQDQLSDIQPETSQAYDLGYRYQSGSLFLSTALWYDQFHNRIVRVFDQDQGINISRNIGDVNLWGAELQAGYQLSDALSGYLSAAWTDSEVQNDLPFGAGVFALTKGKKLVETPDWTFGARVEYETGPLVFGVQAKYVGDRFSTDVNDQVAPAYTTVDLDARWNLGDAWRNKNTYLQLNVINLFDEDYFGTMSTQISSTPGAPGTGIVRYNLGSPRTVTLALRTEF